MPPRSWLAAGLLLAALGSAIFIFPSLAGIWSLNLANISIARAAALPSDAPARVEALAEADGWLTLAKGDTSPRLSLARARAALLRNDAPRAADLLDESRLLSPDPLIEWVWASADWQANRREQALAHWRNAGAITYFMQEAHRSSDAHAWKRAAELASIAAGIDPGLADAHYVLGDALSHGAGDTLQAESELEAAQGQARDPEFLSTVISRRAEILASQGQLTEALDLFGQARQVAPLDARPRTGYAVTVLKLQPADREQAAALLQQVVGDSPWYAAAYVALAQLAESNGDLQGAEGWLDKGLTANPNNSGLLFSLGQFYIRQRRFEDAQKALVLALRFEIHADDLQTIALALEGLNLPK